MKAFWGIFIGIMLMAGICFAETTSQTANVSCKTTYVDATTKYQNITFPTNIRHLTIINNDASQYVWVNPKSDTATSVDTTVCFLLKPSTSLELFDFITGGISILYDNSYGSGEASPISVIATY